MFTLSLLFYVFYRVFTLYWSLLFGQHNHLTLWYLRAELSESSSVQS